MSISNLENAFSGFQLGVNSSVSRVSEASDASGIDDIVFTDKAGSYKATWQSPGAITAGTGIPLAIQVPWSDLDIEQSGVSCCLETSDPKLTLTITSIVPQGSGARVLFTVFSGLGSVDAAHSIRFSLC
jgi:hypothetical protein